MALIIQKYGGTSVANIERIQAVAERVRIAYNEGHQLVVVVSARAGVTNELLERARQITPFPNKREMDMLLAVGEQETIALLAIALNSLGLEAVSRTGAQAGIVTNQDHTRARICNINGGDILHQLSQQKIVIVAGFQGVSADGHITTLGRGGSDLTAIALGAVLKADLVQVFTDVAGVFTADPRIVPDATKIDSISYDELLELSSLGAKVMQARSVEFAQKYNVPFEVRSSFHNQLGTLVKNSTPFMEDILVRGAVMDVSQAKITIDHLPDSPATTATIFQALGENGLLVDMIVQNVATEGQISLTFTVNRDDLARAKETLIATLGSLNWSGSVRASDVALISVVGLGMRSHSGVAATMFKALERIGVRIQLISTSEIKISCAIDPIYAKDALREVHSAFKLNEPEAKRVLISSVTNAVCANLS